MEEPDWQGEREKGGVDMHGMHVSVGGRVSSLSHRLRIGLGGLIANGRGGRRSGKWMVTGATPAATSGNGSIQPRDGTVDGSDRTSVKIQSFFCFTVVLLFLTARAA
jgi:hypothetical protein